MKIDESLRALCGLKEGNILAVIHKEVLGQDSGAAGVANDVEVLLDVGISVGEVGPETHSRQMVFRGFVQARCQLVSLGLALGLSALSSRQLSFANLFIDEGFGTLDPEALATVIDALSMLQTAQGKKVCVISHTDTMSERITTQIRVSKNGNTGSSRIDIVAG